MALLFSEVFKMEKIENQNEKKLSDEEIKKRLAERAYEYSWIMKEIAEEEEREKTKQRTGFLSMFKDKVEALLKH